jgi:hypothetical protein
MYSALPRWLAVAREAMRLFVPSCLIVTGAVLGGIIPGASCAHTCAPALGGLLGSDGKVIWFATNLVFGVGGAFYGGLCGRGIQPTPKWWFIILFSIIAGLVAGAAGFLWWAWMLSLAAPPL